MSLYEPCISRRMNRRGAARCPCPICHTYAMIFPYSRLSRALATIGYATNDSLMAGEPCCAVGRVEVGHAHQRW